jgi:3-dehydroquinate dehydratase/shikimate dehydrogenase
MWEAGADIAKVATFANDISDCARVLQLLRSQKGPTIALCMGEKGQIVRLLASKYRGYLTFAAMSPERASAPGQPTVQQMRGLFRAGQQQGDTKLYGIIGNPVGHSKSPLIHNTAFQHIGALRSAAQCSLLACHTSSAVWLHAATAHAHWCAPAY